MPAAPTTQLKGVWLAFWFGVYSIGSTGREYIMLQTREGRKGVEPAAGLVDFGFWGLPGGSMRSCSIDIGLTVIPIYSCSSAAECQESRAGLGYRVVR